jgi:rhamnogalacturonan endolyase
VVVLSKEFDTSVKGNQILVKFDWYPGKVNDKGDRAYENGGEFRIIDSSNNIVFTLNNTNNAPLTYFTGGRTETAAATGIMNPEAWYHVEINFDLSKNEVVFKITDTTTNAIETYTSSLEEVAFDGSVASVKLVGVRTSGNNITWTSHLDNFGIYNVSIPDNTITKVDKLPYQRVYVDETSEIIESIGLPEIVTVTLANNSKADVHVSEWISVGKAWNPNESGVYEFTGILSETEGLENSLDRYATIYVYNRFPPVETPRQAEWLDRGVVALKSDEGIFISWRLLADEYDEDVTFNVYRNGKKLNNEPLFITNYVDSEGLPGDTYQIETLVQGISTEEYEAAAVDKDYLSIPMQKPEGGITATGDYTYSVNDASVGDLDGDGEYEVIVKWYPSNAIDSSQAAMTGPTIFDAYKLDGTLLWRINMGLNLTSGAHYHQFIVSDFDGDGKSEFLIKTADATTVYGVTNGKFDSSKVISIIGESEDNGKWVNESGHVYGGPEYISVFNGGTGEVIDTIDYTFALGDVASWGDTWHNRSDRFLAGLAYLDGVSPSAIYGRGYYERTTFAAYNLVDGKLQEVWNFDSAVEGRGGGLGYHSLATGDVDNDGFDEIIAGSLTLDHDGTILYAMDGEMGREPGSHGDALHVGAFDPNREGLHVMAVHEVPAVASIEYHDGATGETLMSFNAYKDAGRGLAANLTSLPGYEFWGTAGPDAPTGGGIYNVQGSVIANSFRDVGLSVNFALYWDGDLLHELLDNTTITKYNESTGLSEVVRSFEGVVSNNGTKATPTLQADILGDWREEVLLPTTDSSELRIFSTTIPSDYRLYTLMHDTVYRMGIAWQNSAYNQPPHLGFYLGEDIRETVLSGELNAPHVTYSTNIDSMRRLIDRYVKLGQLNGPLIAQLTNKLKQAEHQLDVGRPNQAAKHMEDFIKHLNKSSLKDHVQEHVKTYLNSEALRLIELWNGLASE